MVSKVPRRRVALLILIVIFLAVGAGALYNFAAIYLYRRSAGIPGKLYDVTGYSMHMYCTGQGSPTLVLSSGLGDDFTSWGRVQPALSRHTRVCSYDRAGFGWSEYRPGPQDAEAIASQLHTLVRSADIARPFVLIGHSVSGIYIRYYAAHYGEDLAGLVFVDGATPLQDDRFTKELVDIERKQRREMPWQKLLMTFGWYRLRGECTTVPQGFESYSAWIKADSCIPSQIDAMESELDAEHASGEETLSAGPFGSLPVLILSRDPNVLAPNWPVAISQANSKIWEQMQEQTKHLSGESYRVIAKGSDHYVQNDRPDLLITETASLVDRIRSRQALPDDRSTIEQ